jgi:hypothetical protein
MKRLLLATAAAFSSAPRRRPNTPEADHDRGAVRRRRADRQGRADLAEALRKPSATRASSSTTSAAPAAPRRREGRACRDDGYTLLLHHIGMATSPALYRKMTYDTLGDFEYLGMINEVPMTDRRPADSAGQQLRRAGEVARGEQGQDQPRQRRPRRRLAPVRPAVPEHA